MEFDDQEDHEETGLPPSYDSLGNSSGLKISSSEAPPTRRPRYRECLKNHAVGIGGHAIDGCGEFMAAGAEGTLDALKCAACNCHRNFHRKESDSAASASDPFGFSPHHHHLPPFLPAPHHHQFSAYYRSPSGYLHVAPHQRPLALPSTWAAGEDQEDMSNPSTIGGLSKKRCRTKFTQEQKDKMLGLAERLGWRMQKQDEEAVQQFCNETGVKRHVLKVWMHNNKHTLGKKP